MQQNIDTSKIEIDGIDLTQDLSSISTEQLFEMREHAYQTSALHCSMQVTLKTCRNSMYGATSNKHYAFCNIEVAEDITAEGRFYIHTGERLINEYMRNKWHLDYELHKKIAEHPLFKDEVDLSGPIEQLPEKDRVLYIDTDSIYVDFEDLLESLHYHGKHWADLIVFMNDERLAAMFDKGLTDIVNKRHGKSVLLFDLETIADTAIFMAKKKYVQCIQWQDGRMFEDPLQHIKGKGIELIQTGSSQLVRDMLKYAYQAILGNKLKTAVDYKKLIQKLWKRFEREENIELLCAYVNAGKFKTYVLDDVNEVKMAPRCLPQYRGAALHNYLVRKHKLMTKYKFIENGRMYWYMIDKNKALLDEPFDWDAFAFNPAEYPEEFAKMLPMDKLYQFFKLVVSPLERIASLTGINTADPLGNELLPTLI